MSLLLLFHASSVANEDLSAITNIGTTGVVVLPGSSYSGVSWTKAATQFRATKASLVWYDVSGTLISTVDGTPANNNTSTWTRLTVTATAPTTARFVALKTTIASSTTGEVHYVDDSGIFRMSSPSPY